MEEVLGRTQAEAAGGARALRGLDGVDGDRRPLLEEGLHLELQHGAIGVRKPLGSAAASHQQSRNLVGRSKVSRNVRVTVARRRESVATAEDRAGWLSTRSPSALSFLRLRLGPREHVASGLLASTRPAARQQATTRAPHTGTEGHELAWDAPPALTRHSRVNRPRVRLREFGMQSPWKRTKRVKQTG